MIQQHRVKTHRFIRARKGERVVAANRHTDVDIKTDARREDVEEGSAQECGPSTEVADFSLDWDMVTPNVVAVLPNRRNIRGDRGRQYDISGREEWYRIRYIFAR